MPDILNKYFDSIGGDRLLRSLNHHIILCHNKAKGIHQVVKEIFDYQTLYFKIEVSIDDDIIALTEGNSSKASSDIRGVTKTLHASEINDVLLSIPLIPEWNLYQAGFSTTKATFPSYEWAADALIIYFNQFESKTTFCPNTGLKTQTQLIHQNDPNLHLHISYHDWRWVDGLYIPFRQNYSSPHMESVREIESIHLRFDQ